jgi:hypothetical protein
MTQESAGIKVAVASDWALRNLPARAATFLHVVGAHGPIRAAMQQGGYRPKDHEEGLRLLVAACALGKTGVSPTEDEAPRAATETLVAWASVHVPRLQAAVQRCHPKLPDPFAGLDFSEPGAVVLSSAKLLARLVELETDESCTPMLDTLTKRAFDPAQRDHLRHLVETAQRAAIPCGGFPSAAISSGDAAGQALANGLRGEASAGSAQLALYRWYADWTTTAKALILRKDWLLRLGLRRQRRATERA